MSRDDILKEFGLRVKQLRLAKGLSQEELGDACDLDRTYISGIERGVRNPSLVGVFNISVGLDIDFDFLVKDIGKKDERKNKKEISQ